MSGVTGQLELYDYLHASEVGKTMSGVGGITSTAVMSRDRREKADVQKYISQEMLVIVASLP